MWASPLLIAVAALLSVTLPHPARAQPPCAPRPIALIESVRNDVRLLPASTGAPVPGARQRQVCAGDTIQVGDDSRAVIVLLDSNTPLVIDQNSEFYVADAPAAGRTIVDLVRGALLFISRIQRSIEIRTPFVNAAVEGTELVVRVEADRSVVTVLEGVVRASNPFGTLILSAGQQAVAIQGQPPELQLVVRPRDAVQWALHYEPVLPEDSFGALAAIPESARDATFYVRRAGLLLGAGQLEEARADLVRAEALDPASGAVPAVRAIIAVALNDRGGALQSGRQAVALAPSSAPAWLALWYALQAVFDLEGARDAALEATRTAPESGAAWARLAELRLMLQDVDGAVAASRQAVSLAPGAARAHASLGFALLARLDVADAQRAFEAAIDLEPDHPLARLGLGLARIREGQLSAGRADIELAVALNPDSSLLRSYLGKAYFDERREPLPADQLALAKELDPLDPTPWFYDAIRKQTLNRPVEALSDLGRAIGLNDNRVVYRSHLLLDQDLAARSASLARIHRDLGFEQLALVQGWRSVETNPGDHSGHRLLADTYSALPRHEVARVSELLQAQLLQPINITPVPPSLAETDLFILEAAGPSEQAFNEFNPLFNRNRLALHVGGALGGDSMFGDDVAVSTVWNNVSLSVGHFHYDTDGVRLNDHQDRDLYNAFVQAQLTHATSVQAELRFDEAITGAPFIGFDPTDTFSEFRHRATSRAVRAGVRHVLGPRSLLIASLYLRHRRSTDDTDTVAGPVPTNQSTESSFDGFTGEVRHLFRTERLSVTSGAGHFDGSRRIDELLRLGPPVNSSATFRTEDDPRQTNAYLYTSADIAENLVLTLGLSGDWFERAGLTRRQANPKFGATWSPTPSTTIRLAAFRTLHRSVVSNQTIEPTHVAGFNQFFADFEAQESRHYGMAIDHDFGRRLYAGASYSWRSLRLPVLDADLEGNMQAESTIISRGQDAFGRSYCSWTLTDRTAVSLEYHRERLDREGGEEGFLDLRTSRLPIALRYFTTSGLIAGVQATYVAQEGMFLVSGRSAPDDSRFWTVDASLGYRLPGRYGRLVLEVRNLLDEEFRFHDTSPGNPAFRPGRLAALRFVVGL